MPKIYQKNGVKTQFPTPKFREFRDNGPRKNAIEFFLYWKRIDGSLHDFIEVRVYQLWPVCDFKITEPDRRTVEKEIIGGTCPFEPEQYREKFMELFGSGEWHLVLNEKGVAGAVTECWFSAIDLERYPPKVDLRCVLPGVHANKEYIRFLRSQNVQLPWELPEDVEAKKKEQEEEMATTDALQTMADSNAKLAEKNMDLAERVASANKTDKPAAPESSPADRASDAALDIMTHATNSVVDMVTKHSGTQYDPIQMIETVMKFAKPERPEGESDSIRMMSMFLGNMKESNEKMLTMQREQFDFMKSVTLGRQDGSTAVAVAPKGFVEQLREYKEISDLLGMSRGRRDREEPEPAAPSKSWGVSLMENIGPIISGITTIGAIAANIVYNFKLKPGEQAQAPAQAMQQAQQATPQATPMPGAQQQPTPEQMAQAWAQVMDQQIKPPLLAHLFGNGTNGYTFAEFVISDGTMAGPKERGRKFYMTLKEQLKPEGFMMLVRGNAGIWSQVSTIPEQFTKFMEEFFSYDEWVQEQNEPVEQAAGA